MHEACPAPSRGLNTPQFNLRSERDLSRQGQSNVSRIFAGQAVGIKDVHDDIWLVSSMEYDLDYFDLKTRVLEPLDNPLGPKVLPMC